MEHILPHLLWRYPKVHWNAYIRAVVLLDDLMIIKEHHLMMLLIWELIFDSVTQKLETICIHQVKQLVNISIIGGGMIGEVGKLPFLLTERVSASLRVLRALEKVPALIYFCWDLFTTQSHTLFACSFLQEWVCLLSWKNISQPGMSMELVRSRAVISSQQSASIPICRLKQCHCLGEPK